MKLTRKLRQKFEEGEPLKASSLTEAMELERKLGRYYPSLKWGGEERLGFHRIDIDKEEFPIIFYKENDSLYWDNAPEEEENEND